MGDRNPGIGRGRHCGRHTWNDFEFDSGRRQRFGLFSTTAKHEGVAAFQTDHDSALLRPLNEHAIDRVLRLILSCSPSAHIHTFRLNRSMREQGRIREIIVDHDIGPLETLLPSESQKLRVPRPGPDQIHNALSRALQRYAVP